MISRVMISNFKASSRNTALLLAPYSVLTGANGTGKTTILQAIKLAISGNLPEANVSSTADVFKLANSNPGIDQMEVGLTLDTGFSFTRRYSRKSNYNPATGKGAEKISQDIELSPDKEERLLSDKKARIRQETGLDSIMVDVSSFLNMSDDLRRDYFYRLGGPGTVTIEQIAGILTRQSGKTDAFSKTAFDKLIEDVNKQWAQPGYGNLEKLLAWLSDRKKQAASDARTANAATEHIGRVKERQQTVAGDLESVKNDLERAREEKEKLTAEISKHSSQVAAVRERESRLEELTGKISKLKQPVDGPDVAAMRKELAEIEKALDKLKNENAVKARSLQAATTVATGLVEEKDKQRQEELDKLMDLTRRAESANALGELKDQLCKKCQKLVGDLADMSGQVEAARIAGESAKTELSNARDAATKATVAETAFRRESEKAETELTRKLETLPHDIQLAEQKEDVRKADLADAEKVLKSVQENRLDEPLPMEETKARLEGLQARINELNERLEAKQEEESEIRLQLQSIAAAQTSETKLFCVKQAIKLLGPSGLKGDLVKETLQPIRQEVNECLRLFGIQSKEFSFRTVDARGNEVFDFGWNDLSGRFVAFDSLSTGQQTMLLASLVAVICRRSDSPLKLLALDNLEVVSSDNSAAFYSGLPAVAKYCGLDNLIVASSKDDDFKVERVNARGDKVIEYVAPKGLTLIRFPLEQPVEAEQQVAEAVSA